MRSAAGFRSPPSTTWTDLNPTTKPSARRQPAVGFDPIREQVILFGGQDLTVLYEDTWMIDSSDEWTELFPADHPDSGSPDFEFPVTPEMPWDPFRERLVMVTEVFGATPRILRVWEWDGDAANWELIDKFCTPTPGGRTDSGIAWDTGGKRILLTSGRDPVSAITYFNDTWLYGGRCFVPQIYRRPF